MTPDELRQKATWAENLKDQVFWEIAAQLAELNISLESLLNLLLRQNEETKDENTE